MNDAPPSNLIEIVCGVDANYAPHLGVLLRSIAATNSGQSFRINVLHDGIDDAVKEKVSQCAPAMQIIWYEIINHRVLEFQPLLQITRATYLRLALTKVIPQGISRILYLDVDMIVNGSLTELWNSNLGKNVCAAIIDPGVALKDFSEKYRLPMPGQYFNAGVLLLDMPKLREGLYLERAIELLEDSKAYYEYADQDALNVVLWQQWLALDTKWNFQRKFLYSDFAATCSAAKPVIIHYTETYKPWRGDEWHPHAWLYLKNLLHTPFKKDIMRQGKIGFITSCKWALKYWLKRF